MPDPQFTKTIILRPYDGFTDDYTLSPTSAAERPIMLTEGGVCLDKQAGKPGYSDFLVRGIPVPMGARALLWIPRLHAEDAAPLPYDWHIIWRLRSVYDYRQTRAPFHYPKQTLGALGPPPGSAPQVVIPAAYHSIVYNQTEPAFTANQSQHLIQEQISLTVGDNFSGTNVGLPINQDVAGAAGTIQQGVYPGTGEAFDFLCRKPLYMVHEVMCAGDEMLIGITRAPGAQPNWDFAGADRMMSILFDAANPDVGVYLHLGTSF